MTFVIISLSFLICHISMFICYVLFFHFSHRPVPIQISKKRNQQSPSSSLVDQILKEENDESEESDENEETKESTTISSTNLIGRKEEKVDYEKLIERIQELKNCTFFSGFIFMRLR